MNRAGPTRRGGWLAGVALFALGLSALAGCAAPARTAVPADLPYTAREQAFELRWALQREAGAVRAIGLARTLANQEAQLTLGLFGLDGTGRIVSRASDVVRFRFARDDAPFAVALRPTGQETRFELHILGVVLNNFRTN